ncbi:MAG: UvrD-helicase domain-containing protein [Myxococcales bacterium]|nr:UvrD-helicase domain-containing protein [Myxococcales bacterium]
MLTKVAHACFARKIKTVSHVALAIREPGAMDLNPQQRKAVLTTEGPVLVLAGAGSGKTRVIAHRIAHLLEHGVPARAILAVTFTNKAAREMKERVSKLAGDAAKAVTVSTFHSFGLRIVREQRGKVSVLDSGDQTGLVKRLLRDLKIDDKRFDVGRILSIISRKRCGGPPGHPDDEYELCATELLPKYELGLRALNAVDFDDLLLVPLGVFREKPDVLAHYQQRYRYLLVDEYQDTNDVQLALLELLAGMRRNLCVVGDDDQSIYAWRGAQVRHIQEFDKKFPGCVEIFLEQNYRSNGNILDAANAIIGRNPGRKPKRLWTDRGRGPNVKLVAAPDDEAEARYVADEIIRVSYEEKIPLREFAVLYRTNAQARPFEEALRLAGVRYRVVGGTSLFDRKEVRDLLAYLRAALNPRDEISLLRIVNVPARGIGDQTIARVQEQARAAKQPVWEALRTEERAAEFVELLETYGARLSQRGFSEAARDLVEQVGLFDEARRGAQSVPAQARKIEAIESLLRQLIEYEQREEQKTSDEPFAAGLPGYLARLALDSKDDDGDAGDAVTLMTLHGAKGLEWRCVFLCGLEEGLLPHSGQGFDEPGSGNVEEERRLCYVGFTRARERLVLTRAAQRIRRGKAIPRTPSRFIDDIPRQLLDVVDLAGPQPQAPKEVQQQKAKSFFANMSELLADGE